jgi:hypothetical protein
MAKMRVIPQGKLLYNYYFLISWYSPLLSSLLLELLPGQGFDDRGTERRNDLMNLALKFLRDRLASFYCCEEWRYGARGEERGGAPDT